MSQLIKQLFQSTSIFIQYVLGRLFPRPIPVYPSITVVRPNDLLVLRFEFINLKLQKTGEGDETDAYLIPGENALLAVHFQPQNLAEQAFLEEEGGGGEPLKPPPVNSRLAGSSRLVFK